MQNAHYSYNAVVNINNNGYSVIINMFINIKQAVSVIKILCYDMFYIMTIVTSLVRTCPLLCMEKYIAMFLLCINDNMCIHTFPFVVVSILLYHV